MAVSDNLGLYLPTREDYVSVKRDISDNFEEVDDFAGGVMNGLAIVADGDTHIAIASGQYVYIRNNPNGVSEGMYTANSAISANASIYPANVTSVSGGISNALNGKLPEIFTQTKTITTNSDGVVIFYDLSASSNAILSATIVRDGSAYNSWAGFIPGASGDGFLSLKMIDNGVNPVKSLPSTTAKVKLTILRLYNIPDAT